MSPETETLSTPPASTAYDPARFEAAGVTTRPAFDCA
jgi:hypothetical protein